MDKKNIALLTDFSLLLGINPIKSGGELVEVSLSKSFLNNYDNVYVIPKLSDFNSVVNGLIAENVLENYKYKNRILGLDCLSKRDIKEYLNCILKELCEKNFGLVVDLNYHPGFEYQNLIKNMKNMGSFGYLFLRFGEVFYLSHKANLPGAIILQGEGLTKIRLGFPLTLLKYEYRRLTGKLPLDFFFNKRGYIKYKGLYEQLLVTFLLLSTKIKRIYGVSRGQLENLGISWSKKSKVVFPPFGLREKFIAADNRNIKKKNYSIFCARLIPLKGTLEIPYIVKEIIKSKEDFVIYVAGSFPDGMKDLFFKEVEELGVEENVKYLGFLKDEELEDYLKGAKVLIYPSHEDSFSVIVLESIYFRTPVVAYDILGPKSVYINVPIVRFVKEYDYKEMAQEALKILNMDEKKYYEFIYDKGVDDFIKQFIDWKAIASNYYADFLSLIFN